MAEDEGKLRALRCISLNVNGLNNPIKKKKILSYLNSSKADIAFIQETHLTSLETDKFKSGWTQMIISNTFSSKSRGVSILIRKNVRFQLHKTFQDTDGRILLLKVTIEETDYTLGCIYAPNSENPTFFHKLSQEILNLGSNNVILAGDFNITLDPLLDKTGPYRQLQSPTRQAILKMMDDLGLTDVWRLAHPTERDYTFYSAAHKSHSRIDMFLVSIPISNNTTTCYIEEIVVSDHALIGLDFLPGDAPKFMSRWRLNSSLLLDQNFVNMINIELKDFLEINMGSVNKLSTVWEALKCFIRGKAIAYASRLKKNRTLNLSKATETLKKTNAEYKARENSANLAKLIRARNEVNEILSAKAEFALFRVKQNYWESGERAGKLLSYRLKQMDSQKTICGIRSTDGSLKTSTSDINQEFTNFYTQLYKSDIHPSSVDIEAFLSKLNLPCLDDTIADRLAEPFSVGEINMAIESLHGGKTPGPDGLPAEFYKTFAEVLTPFLHKVFLEGQSDGLLPESTRSALITVIHKDGKSKEDCGNYRPISLINVDGKIYAKVLAQRLDKVMNKIIDPHQAGFIKGRDCTDNIRLFLDILNLKNNSIDSYAAISLDAEKAFDRVHWQYLFRVLSYMGFPPAFIDMIRLIYNDPRSRVLTNGFISAPVALERGTRQGCPLSPLLFDIALEPLAACIRQDSEITGIVVKGREYKEIMYADDTLLFVSKPETTVPKILNTIKTFGALSGYKINWSKSEVMPLSIGCSPTHFSDWPFRWKPVGFKYLGICFQRDLNKILPSNLDAILDKFTLDIERWSTIGLSLWGKINCIKMNFSPRILYILRSLPIKVPPRLWSRAKKLIRTFLWGRDKKPLLSFKKLELPVSKGGFNFPNWETYHRASILQQASRLIDSDLNDIPPWIILERDSLFPVPSQIILSSKILPSVRTCLFTVKWARNTWSSILKMMDTNFYVHPNAPLWGNPKFPALYKKTIYMKWLDKNIMYLKDIIKDGNIIPFNILKETFHLQETYRTEYTSLLKLICETHVNLNPLTNNATSSLELLIVQGKRLNGKLSWYYKHLLNITELDLSPMKEKWTTLIGIMIDDLDWQQSLSNIHSSTYDLRLRWIQQRILFGLYWTPSRMFRFGLQSTDICWNCKMGIGDILHMFWSCSRIQTFWKEVTARINLILGMDLTLNPSLVILGNTANISPNNSFHKKWIILALLCAKKEILRNWKSDHQPSIESWLTSLSDLASMEKIRWKRIDKIHIFHKIWKNFLDLYST